MIQHLSVPSKILWRELGSEAGGRAESGLIMFRAWDCESAESSAGQRSSHESVSELGKLRHHAEESAAVGHCLQPTIQSNDRQSKL